MIDLLSGCNDLKWEMSQMTYKIGILLIKEQFSHYELGFILLLVFILSYFYRNINFCYSPFFHKIVTIYVYYKL